MIGNSNSAKMHRWLKNKVLKLFETARRRVSGALQTVQQKIPQEIQRSRSRWLFYREIEDNATTLPAFPLRGSGL